ncbi:MAG: tetratricopeptide repeat protein [Pseudomonadota bacterium]
MPRGLVHGVLLTAVAVLLTACASSGSKPGKRAEAAEAAAGPAAFGAEVPAAAQTLYEQAVAVMAAGDFVDAELRFKEFLLQYPAYPGAWVNLAIIHRENGDDEQALADIEKALAIDPNNAVALNQKGFLLRRNGNFLEAEAAYLKAVTASPDYALAHYNLGVLNELYLQRLDAALQHFEIYQSLVGEDKQVEKWIGDLQRRVAASQRTANVAE